MELTVKQKQGLQIALKRFEDGKKYTVISGYAGTGKSTLVKFIVSALPNIKPDLDVVYTSFTGKATQVLQKKGNKNVSTLHKLLFTHYPRPDGSFIRKPVSSIPYKVVIVDECSMMPQELWERLLSYEAHIICLGDPFQLPPVNKNEDNHLLDNPHVFLDEIMRQEEQSEIIKLTMDIRNGKPLNHYVGREVQILDKNELSAGMLLWADQIICSTNATRISLNKQMRDLLGHEEGPQDGDKVICLKNNWDKISLDGNPLVNGTIGYIKNPFTTYIQLPRFMSSTGKTRRVPILLTNFISDTEDDYGTVDMDKKLVMEGEPDLNWKETYLMGKSSNLKNSIPNQFAYGYAITCHKAQGSEWDNVLVIEESSPFDKEEHARWLYTACTRAAKKLVIIRK